MAKSPLLQISDSLQGLLPQQQTEEGRPHKAFVGVDPDDVAFRYWLDLGCVPRQAHPWGPLLLSGDALRTLATSPTGTLAPAQRSSLQQQGELAASVEDHCTPCQANVWGRSFGQPFPVGCSGAIPYPLSAAAEQALALGVEHILRGGLPRSDVALLAMIIDNQLQPERVQHLRHLTDPPFFEAAHGLALHMHTDIGDIDLTTDHLWEALMGYTVPPAYARGAYVPFFDRLEEALAAAPTDQVGPLGSDRTVAGLRLLGNAYRLCATLDVDLVTLL